MQCKPKEACEILGVHIDTLRNWDRKGLISTVRTEGGHRRFLLTKDGRPIRTEQDEEKETIIRRDYIYCRVSSSHQKKDLQRQIESMQEKHPDAELIKDIGSGINYKRHGLKCFKNSNIL
jgi:putative resolvase